MGKIKTISQKVGGKQRERREKGRRERRREREGGRKGGRREDLLANVRVSAGGREAVGPDVARLAVDLREGQDGEGRGSQQVGVRL